MDWLTNLATTMIFPLLVGPLTYVISEKAQQASAWLQKQPAASKQIITAALATAIAAGGKVTASFFPGGIESLDAIDANAVATWAVAMATHGLVKARAKKVSGKHPASSTSTQK